MRQSKDNLIKRVDESYITSTICNIVLDMNKKE